MSKETRGFEPKEDQDSEDPDSENIVEIRRSIGKMDVGVDIKKEGDPFNAQIDWDEGRAEIAVTPEGVRRGLEAVHSFLTDENRVSRVTKQIRSAREKIQQRRQNLQDREQIRKFAEQEGMTEEEVVEMFLDELESSQEDKSA